MGVQVVFKGMSQIRVTRWVPMEREMRSKDRAVGHPRFRGWEVEKGRQEGEE